MIICDCNIRIKVLQTVNHLDSYISVDGPDPVSTLDNCTDACGYLDLSQLCFKLSAY